MSATDARRHVVIVGGGFAGLGCARRLAEHDDIHVTLLDRNNYHQFQPLLYQVATSQLSPGDIAHSLRAVFAENADVDVKLAEVSAVDTATRTVRSSEGDEWTGDAVVLAAGSQPNFFGTRVPPKTRFRSTRSTTPPGFARGSSGCSSRQTCTRRWWSAGH